MPGESGDRRRPDDLGLLLTQPLVSRWLLDELSSPGGPSERARDQTDLVLARSAPTFSAMASTSPAQVKTLASAATLHPRRLAVSEVTGLRLARRISRPTRSRPAWLSSEWSRSVIAELVKVTQSRDPCSIRSATVAGSASASALR